MDDAEELHPRHIVVADGVAPTAMIALQRTGDGLPHKGGQTLRQIAQSDAGAVGGDHLSPFPAGAPVDKVPRQLGGSPVAAAIVNALLYFL